MSYVSTLEYENKNLLIKDKEARNLIDNLRNVNNRNLIILGDSYTTGDDSTGGHITPWTEDFKNDIASYFNNVKIFASNGIGFATGLGFNFFTLLQSNINNIDTTYPTTIFIVGGYNDVGKTTLHSDITYILNSIKNLFNDVKIVVAFVGNSVKYRSLDFFNAMSIYKYGANNVDKCIGVNGSENILCLKRLYTNDGYHPNTDGQYFLRCYLKSALLSNCVNISTYGDTFFESTDYLISSVGGVAKSTGFWFTENNNRTVRMEINCENTNIQVINDNYIKFGDFNCDFINNPYILFPIVATLQDSDGNYYKELCLGKIENSAFSVSYNLVNTSGWSNKKIIKVNFKFDYVTSAFAF